MSDKNLVLTIDIDTHVQWMDKCFYLLLCSTLTSMNRHPLIMRIDENRLICAFRLIRSKHQWSPFTLDFLFQKERRLRKRKKEKKKGGNEKLNEYVSRVQIRKIVRRSMTLHILFIFSVLCNYLHRKRIRWIMIRRELLFSLETIHCLFSRFQFDYYCIGSHIVTCLTMLRCHQSNNYSWK